MGAFFASITSWIQGLIEKILASAGGFITGWFSGVAHQKNADLKKVEKDERADLDIANGPVKHGSDLIDGL